MHIRWLDAERFEHPDSNLAAELESGRLLTYDGDGHTAYEQGSGCIDDAVDAFIIDATLPAAGKRCR